MVVAAAREVSVARAEEGKLADYLAPAAWNEAAPVLSPLFDLPMKDNPANEAEAKDEARRRKAAFQLTIAGEPLWAIKETVAAFVTGRAGNGFCPNSAVFGKELRERTSAERSKWQQAIRRRREAEELAAEEAIARQPMSEEARRTVNETLARMEAKAAEMRKAAVAPRQTDRSEVLARVSAMTATLDGSRLLQWREGDPEPKPEHLKFGEGE